MTIAEIYLRHDKAKRDYESDCALRGLITGVIVGAFMWAGLYGFLRLMVGLLGGGGR